METNTAPASVRIGHINACIAGDYRYSSRLEVFIEGPKAHVVLSENGAVGGMDGPGGTTPYRETRRMTVDAKPAAIVKAIKSTMDETIKRYGKPSKSFSWVGTDDRGLSAKLVTEAMSYVSE